jgi:hypothetical protein
MPFAFASLKEKALPLQRAAATTGQEKEKRRLYAAFAERLVEKHRFFGQNTQQNSDS